MTSIQEEPSGTLSSWLAAAWRALRPARWGLVLVGVTASLAVCAILSAFFTWQFDGWGVWYTRPLDELQLLGTRLVDTGTARAVWRCALLAAALALIWSPLGAWIARDELLRHRAAEDPAWSPRSAETTPTRLVRGRARQLCWLMPFVEFTLLFLLLPALLAGQINRMLFWGIGAVMVAVVLPVALLGCLAFALVLPSSLCYPLLVVATAAEGSDHFDVISRGFSYILQRPVRFFCWSGLVVIISGLPVLTAQWLATGLGLGAGQTALAQVLGAGLGLSLFWTLESLVYLKVRRSVDGVAEDHIWDGTLPEPAAKRPGQQAAGGNEPASGLAESRSDEAVARLPEGRGADAAASADAAALPAAGPEVPSSSLGRQGAIQSGLAATALQSAAPPTPAPVVLTPKRPQLSFWDAAQGGSGMLSVRWLVLLLLGMLWPGLVLAAGGLLASRLAGEVGPGVDVDRLPQAVGKLAEQRPGVLAAIAAAVILLGPLSLARPLRAVGRMAAVDVVYQLLLSSREAWSFVIRTRWRGLRSILLISAGLQLGAVAALFLSVALRGACPWGQIAAIWAAAIVLLITGAFGLGAVAVEGAGPREERVGTAGVFLGNFLETLASAAVNLVVGLLRWVTVLALAAAAWFILAEVFTWSGGRSTQWLRWGLDGRLWPEAQGGLYGVASWIAGFWFVVFFGLAVAYPVAHAVRWGVSAYLLARQRTEGIPAGQIELSDEERNKLAEQQKKRDGAVHSGHVVRRRRGR
jgi:hypothetical protein